MKKYLYVLTSLVLMSLVSCVNEPFSNEKEHGRETSLVAALGEQVVSVGATVDQLAQIQTEIDNLIENAEEAQAQELSGCKTALQNVVASLESHVDYLKDATWFEGTMATIECQKALASVVASLEIAMGQQFDELESSVSTWVGKDFCMSYSAALALARVQLLGISLNTLSADVTEGLIVAKDSEELAALSVSVAEDAASYAELGTTLDAVVSELTQEYAQAVEAVVVNNTSYDAPALAEYNSNVAVVVKSSTITLNDLVARVSACEAQLENILQAIKDLEAQVEGLLGMIQSVSFISDYSSDYAVAYYALETSKVTDVASPYYSKCERTPVNTVELNFMVSPASSAKALTKENVSVFGYYANQLQPYAVNASSFIDFELDKVELISESRGLVKVVVKHNLKESFYFKGVGAKCALSISTGKTDFVSKFVEIVPKDNSTTVYVQSITPSEKSVTIANGESMTLGASVYPEAASVKTCTWSSSNTNVAKINPSTGVLEAVGVGRATLTVTSNGTDEWGLPVTATVSVVVNEAVRLLGPSYVEVGKTAELTLDFPASMIVDNKLWSTSDETKLAVNAKNGVVTGVGNTYNEATNDYGTVTIYCTINNEITVSHDMKVVVTQPKSVHLNNLADNQSEITMKVDESLSLAGSIMPDDVDPSLFRLYYSSDQSLGWIDSSTGVINAYKNTINPVSAWVYIDVKNADQKFYFAPGASVRRTVVVRVLPYYVKTITLQDVDLQPNASATLVPIFTSDTDGKIPTNTKVTWQSNNTSVATIDENGTVIAKAVGEATITATATDGSGVSATCKVKVSVPWKNFEVGDYVIRKSNGEIEFYSDASAAKNNGTVVGVVIAKVNPRVSDVKLPSECTHGIAMGLKHSGTGTKAVSTTTPSSDPYSLYKYAMLYPGDGYISSTGVKYVSGTTYERNDIGKKPYGYNNTLLLKAFLGVHTEITSGLNDNLINYNSSNTKPLETSDWYLPSIYEMWMAYECYVNNSLNTKLSAVGGDQLQNPNFYWTVSEIDGNANSYFAGIRAMVGLIQPKMKTNTDLYTRYFFAF